MRPVLLAAPAFLLALGELAAGGRVEGAPDSSWRGREVDLTRIELVRSFGPWRPSTLSPSGNGFALYTGNSVRLFDVAKEREGPQLTGHLANIHDSGWSRDGRVLATSGYDGSVRVWEAVTGKSLATLAAHAGYA